jgi:hypothetical protein
MPEKVYGHRPFTQGEVGSKLRVVSRGQNCFHGSPLLRHASMALFYHLDRKGTLSPGSVVTLKPPNYSSLNTVGITIDPTFLASLYPNGLSQHGQYYLIDVGQHTRQQMPQSGEPLAKLSSVLETYWELVRRAEFPDEPSRFESFFAFKTPNEARAFGGGTGPVYEVDANVWEEFDFNLLKQPTSLALQWIQIRQYWNHGASPNPLWECLVKPPAKILRVV